VQAFPDASSLPGEDAAPTGDAAAETEFGGQGLPLDTGAQDIQDAIEGRAVPHAGPTPLRLGRLKREQGLDAGPQVVGDKALVHASS